VKWELVAADWADGFPAHLLNKARSFRG